MKRKGVNEMLYVFQVSAEINGRYEDYFINKKLEDVLAVMGEKIAKDKAEGNNVFGYRISKVLLDTEGVEE